MNTYVTGFTYDDINTFTITDNLGTAFTASINVLSATTISGGTLYGDGSNLTGIPHTTDTFVTGGTYNDSTDIITFTNTTGGTFNVTGITDTFVTGGTYNAGTVNLDFSGNSGFSSFSIDVSALKDDTNTFVTGFTYDNANTFTISDNSGSTFNATINTVTGLTSNGDIEVIGDIIVTGGTGNIFTKQVYVEGNLGLDFASSSVTLGNLVDGTIINGTSLIINSDTTINGNLSATTISATTFYGDGSNLTGIPHTTDTFVSGGTYNEPTKEIKFSGNSAQTTFEVDLTSLVSSISGDTFISSFDYSPNTLTITRNDGTGFTANISEFSAITVTGLTVNSDAQFNDNVTVDGNTLIKGNVTILGTATTINSETVLIKDNILTLNSNATGTTAPFPVDSGLEILRNSATTATLLWEESNQYWAAGLSGSTSKIILEGDSLSLLVSGHTHPIGEIIGLQSALDTKVSGATNLSTTGLFAQKTGQNLEFKGITSTGATVTITNDSTRVNLEVTIPPDDNTFITGFTYDNSNNLTITRDDGTGFTTNISIMSGLTVNGTLSATTISGGTLYGDGSNLTGIPHTTDTFVTGGTYNPATVNLDFSGNTGFSPFIVDVSALKDDTNTFVTGFTYDNNNTFTINDNTGSAFTATFNQVSGLTVNGTLSATTLDGNTILSGGTNLITILDDRDNYVTGTTFGSNQSVTTTRDGIDVLKISGGTNVTITSGGTNLSVIDVEQSIDTGNVLWVDHVFGDDGTALVDRQDKPWSSIATAIGNATTNDTIMVRPGEYVESPFTLVPSTSLVSQGGAKVTFISAATPTGNFITVSGSSYMEGFTVYTPTDDSAALYFNDSTAGIVTSFHDVHFKGSSTTPGPLGKGLVMDTSLATNGKIIYSELRYGGGHLNTLVEVNKGIFALDGMHVPGGQTLNKSIQVNGGRAQLININIGNTNCNTAISVSGTASNTPVVVGLGLNLFNVPTGLEITSNYYDIELQNGRVEAGTENLLISSGLTGEFGKLNLINFIMDSEKIDEPYTWADSEHTIFYSDIGNSQNVSPIIRTHGNLEIGQPNRGSSLSVGRGTEYQKGLHLHSSGSTGEVNLTSSASTKGVVWSFGALAAGEELYIGSSERYPNGDYVNWCGFELTYTGSTGGTYTVEYYSGGTWVDIKYQVTNSEFGYNYANDLFSRTVETEEAVRIAVLKNNGWTESTIFGHAAKWVRITMVTPPASLPQFDLLWLDASHTEINENGILAFYGGALYRDTLLSAGNVFGESGGVLSASVPVGSGGLPTGWDHSIKNSRLNGNGDAIYLQSALPRGLCSAYPLRIKIYFGLDPGDGTAITNSPELITSFLAKGASGTLVADPSGGITPLPRTIENTTTLTSSPGSFATSDLVEVGKPTNTYTGKAMSVQDIEFDISESYEGDGFLLRIELNDDGTPNQDVIIFAVEVDVVKWALGERVQVE